MKHSLGFGLFFCLLIATLTVACAPVKTVEVWEEETYNQPLQKVLVIAVAPKEHIRRQFENVLSHQLVKRGVEAIPGSKVLPADGGKPDRETVLAKVQELGVESVLVARSINKKDITNHQYGGIVLGGVAVYDNGDWYGYGYGFSYDREYDTEVFTISTKLFDVSEEKPVWSHIAQAKVGASREKAVNQLVPTIVEQLEASQLVSKM